MISFFNESVSMPELDMDRIKRVLSRIVEENNFLVGSISYIFCSDTYLLSINQEYLKHDYFTDIITFDYSENNIISGDVFISLERVQENAILYNCTFYVELHRVIIHGILHMIGFDDKTETQKKEMREKEDFYLKYID